MNREQRQRYKGPEVLKEILHRETPREEVRVAVRPPYHLRGDAWQ